MLHIPEYHSFTLKLTDYIIHWSDRLTNSGHKHLRAQDWKTHLRMMNEVANHRQHQHHNKTTITITTTTTATTITTTTTTFNPHTSSLSNKLQNIVFYFYLFTKGNLGILKFMGWMKKWWRSMKKRSPFSRIKFPPLQV